MRSPFSSNSTLISVEEEECTLAVNKWAQRLRTTIHYYLIGTVLIGLLPIIDVVLTAVEVFKYRGEAGTDFSTHFTGSSHGDNESVVFPGLPYAVAASIFFFGLGSFICGILFMRRGRDIWRTERPRNWTWVFMVLYLMVCGLALGDMLTCHFGPKGHLACSSYRRGVAIGYFVVSLYNFFMYCVLAGMCNKLKQKVRDEDLELGMDDWRRLNGYLEKPPVRQSANQSRDRLQNPPADQSSNQPQNPPGNPPSNPPGNPPNNPPNRAPANRPANNPLNPPQIDGASDNPLAPVDPTKLADALAAAIRNRFGSSDSTETGPLPGGPGLNSSSTPTREHTSGQSGKFKEDFENQLMKKDSEEEAIKKMGITPHGKRDSINK